MTNTMPDNGADAHRPRYHFMPPANWMNDPNGMIQWNGQYHLFYQHNPNGAFHGTIHWGHAVSRDLVHWEHLPVALTPTPGGPDEDGCWSGCAVDNNGVPTLVYTGIAPEVQCITTGSGDLLQWEKAAQPVISARPDGLELTGFRDPCVWREGDQWLMALGAGIQDVGGAVLLYQSPDLYHWDYLGPILTDDSGLTQEMWECPSLFRLGDKWVLFVSVTPRASVDYFVGTFDGRKFWPETRARLDYGRYFYAPQTLLDENGRRVMFGWIWEGRSDEAAIRAGWSGLQSVPRILSLDAYNRLLVQPAEEMRQLRGAVYSLANIHLTPDKPFVPNVRGDSLEIITEFERGTARQVGLQLFTSPDGDEHTTLTYDFVTSELALDRSRASLADGVDRDTQTAFLALDAGEPLRLHLFLDRSVIEIFANGRACLTSRVYPTRPDSLRLSFCAQGGDARLRADIWQAQAIGFLETQQQGGHSG